MGREEILSRILSDAREEADALVRAGEERREEIVAAARADAEKYAAEARAETEARSARIREGKEAAARLDGAKIVLAEKRRVLGEIYRRAFDRLIALPKRESLALISRLIDEYAEEGDELRFAEDFAYAKEAASLDAVKRKNLKVSAERAPAGGGFVLRGKVCDRDVSYRALLESDLERHQSELAARIFREREPK